MGGLLTNPDCDGSAEALAAAHAELEEWLDATDPKRLADALAWQCRDLDRLRSRDSDELAPRW